MILSEALRRWLNDQIKDTDRVQTGVAHRLGVSSQQLNHWITGYNKIPVDRLTDLARYFGFPDDAALVAAVRERYPADRPKNNAENTPAQWAS